jgi:hypothetical protein
MAPPRRARAIGASSGGDFGTPGIIAERSEGRRFIVPAGKE